MQAFFLMTSLTLCLLLLEGWDHGIGGAVSPMCWREGEESRMGEQSQASTLVSEVSREGELGFAAGAGKPTVFPKRVSRVRVRVPDLDTAP